MEATGGYERQPFYQLWGAGQPVAIVDPRSVRRFAEAMGRLEKTDHIDCGMIAWYAATKDVKPMPPAAAGQQRLTALVVRLRQLVEAQTVQKNQCRLVTEADALASFSPILKPLRAQIRALEAKIVEAIADDPLWRALDEAFRTIKGVPERIVARLMAQMPEIGILSNKAASKLIGLAPLGQDSGLQTGRRAVRGGRHEVRSLLFVVAEIVRRFDPDFIAFHARLCAAGKSKRIVRVALAHKLLIRLNAKARQAREKLVSAP